MVVFVIYDRKHHSRCGVRAAGPAAKRLRPQIEGAVDTRERRKASELQAESCLQAKDFGVVNRECFSLRP